LGGDEFAIIAAGLDNPIDASRIAQQILDELQNSNENSKSEDLVSTSIGIAIYPNDADTKEVLIGHADTALYRAKAEGRGIYRFYETTMGKAAKERRLIEHELRHAIGRNELGLVYQPQKYLKTGEIIGFEALLRWRNAERGDISPALFIPIAEESRLILQIGEWVLREACRSAVTWKSAIIVAVNVSAVQLHDPNFASTVHAILVETRLPASRLELEITETALVKDMNRALLTLRKLKALGVQIAMDDFGTGYSSLSNLRAFPFDKIKIDGSFIKSIHENEQSATIVRAVLGLGRGLGLPVLAEGIESSAELAFLSDELCLVGQGYYLGRPDHISTFESDVTGDTRADARKTLAPLKMARN
ncbi:MAG: bifunctional diguanylate cyclase/phosphodiesterase, partial [Phyllobacterium sp.]|uniref:putative bifunctional diguanylate cyclase/phosphodiesterase n=1 Tax=Phyllobacterium sp. TaxID=1871046 RepID=UPI0030F2FC3B